MIPVFFMQLLPFQFRPHCLPSSCLSFGYLWGPVLGKLYCGSIPESEKHARSPKAGSPKIRPEAASRGSDLDDKSCCGVNQRELRGSLSSSEVWEADSGQISVGPPFNLGVRLAPPPAPLHFIL